MSIDIEYVEHDVLGHNVTFALDRDNTDWYFQRVRKQPFRNPVHHHLPLLARLKRDGLRYADFGANIGTTSLFSAAMGIPTLAVEAGATNFVLLIEAAKKNGFGALYRPVYVAASSTIGVAGFAENSAWGAISRSHKVTSQMPTAPIHDILTMQGFADVGLIKIDIEGAELDALAGFEPIAEIAAPDLIVESNEVACTRFGYRAQDLWQRMIDMGYDVYRIGGHHRLTRLDGTCAQTAIVEDVLASKRSADALTNSFGYKVAKFDRDAARQALDALEAKAGDNQRDIDFVARQRLLLRD